ncbi:MAG: hypothetical protein ACKVPJ_08605 [Chitinophagales bacterium]
MKKTILFNIILAVFFTSACNKENENSDEEDEDACITDESYKPVIDPDNFITDFNIAPNPFFPLTPGVTLIYEGVNDEGDAERVELSFTSDTKLIMGVTCMIVNDKVFVNGELVEDTDDWFAQDKTGNVWYFGEDVEDYENGVLVSTEGSWEAGSDGAYPGVRMPANPFPGNVYRQEYFPCEAEDMAQDLELGVSITVSYGSFTGCLKTTEYTPLEPGVSETKYYAPGVGYIKIEKDGTTAFIELVDIN